MRATKGAIYCFGNECVDTLTDGNGFDTLYGGTGAYALSGLAGKDFYFTDDAGENILETSAKDSIILSFTFTVSEGVLNVTAETYAAPTGNRSANDPDEWGAGDTLIAGATTYSPTPVELITSTAARVPPRCWPAITMMAQTKVQTKVQT